MLYNLSNICYSQAEDTQIAQSYIENNATIITTKLMDNIDLQHLRHSAAHLLAQAVLNLWPDAKPTIGPAIENGFYYDFDFTSPISEDDLSKIEEEMKKNLPNWTAFTSREVSQSEAEEIYKNNPYKLELIAEIADKNEPITLYTCGGFEDLCRGGHSENPSSEIGGLKLLSLAGAYWRGSEKNKMLTRIYGTAFASEKELENYLNQLEEAKKRDHKKIGRDLELFFFAETSPGMAYWLPKGLIVYNNLYGFARDMYKKHGYQEVATPQLNKKELYETSGHWQHYRGDMFLSPMSYVTNESKELLEGSEVFGIKPMNCPNAMTIFDLKTRSYHDLPLRLADTSLLHRYELSGTLNGLFRIRQFRQDDGHVFIALSQLEDEFARLMNMVKDIYAPFGLAYKLRFGTRPEKFMGESHDWDKAEDMLRGALKDSGQEYFEVAGKGTFYGPKIDILMKDSLGREWQTGTIQLDFQQPKNFKLTYIESDGSEATPVVLHRALLGSLERFLGILIEHYAGAFPLWLAPVHVALLPIADRHIEYAQEVAEKLREQGMLVEVDERSERLQAKIRDHTLQKVPFMGIIGDTEVSEKTLAVRTRTGDDLGKLSIDAFLSQLVEHIDKKK
jgi:threonyl-tRNA synthetase